MGGRKRNKSHEKTAIEKKLVLIKYFLFNLFETCIIIGILTFVSVRVLESARGSRKK